MEELTQDGAQLARTMLMAAAQLAEAMARVQAQRAGMAQSQTTAQAEQARAQIAAERDAARTIFRPLAGDQYWQGAPQLDRVVQAYMAASSWVEHDPEARAALQLIKQNAEVRWEAGIATAARAPDDPDVGAGRERSGAPRTRSYGVPVDTASIVDGERARRGDASEARRHSAPGIGLSTTGSLRNNRSPRRTDSPQDGRASGRSTFSRDVTI